MQKHSGLKHGGIELSPSSPALEAEAVADATEAGVARLSAAAAVGLGDLTAEPLREGLCVARWSGPPRCLMTFISTTSSAESDDVVEVVVARFLMTDRKGRQKGVKEEKGRYCM